MSRSSAMPEAGAAAPLWIKPGYRARSARSFDLAPGERYWNAERIAASHAFQYPVYQLARSLLRRRGARSFLDVGAGPGTKVAELIAPLCSDLVLVDQPSSQEFAQRLLPGARFIAANLDSIDLQLGRGFDLITCADVLEHLENPVPCLHFIRNHLNPGGIALLSTPERDRLRGPGCSESPHPEHVREWNAAEFRACVEHAGLAVLRHALLPQRRSGGVERIAARLLGRFLLQRRWASCQALVCRRAEPR